MGELQGGQFTITILKNLYGFLVDQNYLMGNPSSAVGLHARPGPKVNAGRSFTVAQWGSIEERLRRLPATSVSTRSTFGLHLLYATGLRLSQVIAATDDLLWVEYPPDELDEEPLGGWLLRVVGKGRKVQEVPVPIEVVEELIAYLVSRGLAVDVENIANRGAFCWARRATPPSVRRGSLPGCRPAHVSAFRPRPSTGRSRPSLRTAPRR